MASRTPSRFLIALAAIAVTLRTLGRRRPPAAPRRILIAHHLLLGDTLMLTPLIAKLRERYPGAEIVMTAPRAVAPLYQRRPFGVRALPYDLRDCASVRALLRERGFDLAFVPGDNRYSWLARAMGARWIVAFSGDRPAYKSWPVDQRVPYPDVPAAWGDMVAGLASGPAPAPYDPASWSLPDHAPFEKPAPRYCVLHVGASTPLKLWEAEKWRVLAETLEHRGHTIVWSAGRGERELVDQIDPAHRYLSIAGSLDLAQLMALVRGAACLVSPDTGVAHLGRITGRPTVVLFGPGSHIISGGGEYWRNVPSRSVTLDPFPCRDQPILFKRHIGWVRRCQRRPAECSQNRCMQSIGTAAVLAAIDEVIDRA
jgi:ADP-heptose:LPS heptosyltransferase